MRSAKRGPRLLADSDGVVLLFWAFCTPVLLMFLAIPVDAGMIYIQKGEMQNAADAAALASAQDLPSTSGALSIGEAVSGQHGYPSGGDVSVTVTTPYGGNPNLVEVVITADARNVFGGGLGLVLNAVTTRAVAQKRDADGRPSCSRSRRTVESRTPSSCPAQT